MKAPDNRRDNPLREARARAQEIEAMRPGIRVAVARTNEEAHRLLLRMRPFDMVIVTTDLDNVIVRVPASVNIDCCSDAEM